MPKEERDYVHGAFHKKLAEEIKRVLINCENLGIFLTKKEASAVVAEKSRRGKMPAIEIKEYVKKMRGICTS